MMMKEMILASREILPVELVFSPSWWYKNAGITFDRDFFFHPARRVEDERKMEKIIFEKWGRYGLGEDRNKDRPEVGVVHLAAGYMISEMLGCKVNYEESGPPTVVPLSMNTLDENIFDNAFNSKAFKAFEGMCGKLKEKYGYLTGDVNWSGILNIALDLRGQEIFMDMYDDPEKVTSFFRHIADVLERFTAWVQAETGSSSVSVNRTVKHFDKPVFLHSECSHTMISVENYHGFLFPFDMEWSLRKRPFGIHYCGTDTHRYAEAFAQIPHLDFLDVGWGGDVKLLRNALPDTFLNIRLSPVEIVDMNENEIGVLIKKLVKDSNNPSLTGICCINMDDRVTDDKVDVILETVFELRKELE